MCASVISYPPAALILVFTQLLVQMTAVWVGGAYLKCSLASWRQCAKISATKTDEHIMDTQVGGSKGWTRTTTLQQRADATERDHPSVITSTFSLHQPLSLWRLNVNVRFTSQSVFVSLHPGLVRGVGGLWLWPLCFQKSFLPTDEAKFI